MLAPREDLKALGTERERNFFMPQDDFYKKVGVCGSSPITPKPRRTQAPSRPSPQARASHGRC